ncbi:hypothetical protein Tco_0832414 [Tanacetum coccineum]
MAFCTTLQTRVLALETTKTTQANEINSLKWRVKRPEKKDKKRTHKLKILYKVGLTTRVESSDEEGLDEEDASKQGRRIHDIDADEDITLVNDQDDANMFGVNELDGDEVIVDNVDAAEEVTVVIEKAKLVSVAEETVNTAATTVSTASTIPVTDVEITLAQALAELKSAKPKADKVVIQEPEQGTTTPIVSSQQPSQVKAQDKGKGIMVEEPVLQAEEEEERLALPEKKAHKLKKPNIAWDDVQTMKRVNTFVDYRTELVEESSKKADAEIAQEISSKRTGDELEQERSKRKKLDEDKESEELKQCLEIISDDGNDVTIDATPLSTKSPTIVDYKIYKEGKKNYFQIIRADGGIVGIKSLLEVTAAKVCVTTAKQNTKVTTAQRIQTAEKKISSPKRIDKDRRKDKD